MFQDDYVSPLRVVSGHDPALDVNAMDLREYAQTRNPALVKELPGRKVRWFVLRPLSTSDRVAVDSMASAEGKFLRALIFGLERVELPDIGADLLPTTDVPGRPTAIWGDGEREQLIKHFGMLTLYEIGSVIYARSDWGNGWARGGRCYPLPWALREEVERIERLRAASTPASAPAS